ncbi:MAG TPA: hypothetical protein VFF17_00855 [Thermoanaerobaculia bacterium]|nr:hypothetical protein [Thermoanaerobaculia bacterium]
MSTVPPIEPAPAGLPANRGCWKSALLGCGGVAILLVAAFVGIGIYIQNKPAAVTDLLMERIRSGYAEDVTEEDKTELEGAYADFRQALEARRVSKEDVERVRDAVKLGGTVDRSEVQELTRVFRKAAGTPTPAAEPEDPTPAPAAAPSP